MKTVTKNGNPIYTYKIVNGISTVKGGVSVLKDLNYPSNIINLTTNNSSYADVAGFQDGCSNEGVSGYCSSLIDVTDTANVKVSFSVGSIGSGSSYTGSTTKNSIIMTFLRLGDT